MNFGKTHLGIDRQTWEQGVLSGAFESAWRNLSLQEIENPTWEDFKPLINEIETGGVKWADLPQYQEQVMRPVLADPKTRLLLLLKDKEPVGYALIVGAKPELKNRFWAAAENKSVIEIENLALFKGQRGNGIGKAFFEMMFDDLFKTHDTVYWGCSDFNAKTLVPFYVEKMKMSVLEYDPPKTEFIKYKVA